MSPAVLESRRDNLVHRGMQGQSHCFVVQEGELPRQRVASFYLPPHHLLINFPAGNSRAMIQCFGPSKIASASVRTIPFQNSATTTTTSITGVRGEISTEGMMLRKRLMVSAVLSGLLLYHRGVHHGWRPIGEWPLKASPLSLLGWRRLEELPSSSLQL